jgi:hypothetical protein
MAGHQVKNYPECVVLEPTHYWWIIAAAAGLTPDTDQHITVADFFSNIPVGATFQGVLTATSLNVTNTSIQIGSGQYTPANTTVNFGPVGSVCFDSQAVYVQTANNTVKHISYSTDAIISKANTFTFATLPSSPQLGMIVVVQDGPSGLGFGQTVTTGGANTPYLTWYNNSAWTVIGK